MIICDQSNGGAWTTEAAGYDIILPIKSTKLSKCQQIAPTHSASM